MERKALERLVEAIIEIDENASPRARAERIENALISAQIALWGEDGVDTTDDMHEALRDLSLALMAHTLDREGAAVYQRRLLNKKDEEVAQVVATNNPILSSLIDHSMAQALKPEGPYDRN